MTSRQWVVVFEADGAACSMNLDRLRHLLTALPDAEPVALHCDERFAVQLRRSGDSVVDALAVACSDLAAAFLQVGVADIQPIRVEVLTAEEFEHDCRRAYGG